MKARAFAFAVALVIASSTSHYGQRLSTPSGYLTPPRVIVDILDAAPAPTVIVSPDHTLVALLDRRSMPTIADLAEPIHRIAGTRINPRTNGRQQRTGSVFGITLRAISDGTDRKITVPLNAKIGNVSFSADGKRLSFTNTRENGIELWVADTATGQARLVSGNERLNETGGDPIDWLKDGSTLVVQLVPAGRGPAPAEPRVPTGPNIQENQGKAAPAETYEDMIFSTLFACGHIRCSECGESVTVSEQSLGQLTLEVLGSW